MPKISKNKNNGSSNINGLSNIDILFVIIIGLIIILLIIFFIPTTHTHVSNKIVQINIAEIPQIESPTDTDKQPQNNLNDSKNEVDEKNEVDGTNKNVGAGVGLDSDKDKDKDSSDLSEAELREIFERQLREESAKLRRLVEEEERFIPLVDGVDKLIPLHPTDRIWLEREVGSVVITGRVVLREGMLELFACKANSKEHESIVSIRVTPALIHAALLAVGAESGKPVQMKPEFVAPSGDEIEIRVKWRDENGQVKDSLAQDWVWDNANSRENNKKPMKTHWVFTGSLRYKDEEGKDHYVADETGELLGLSNFVGSILDIPIQSSADNDKLLFSCFTEKIPPLGTLVTIILTPRKNK